MATIDGTNMTKIFGATRALDGADLVVEAGQVHGFLGPNGAGKSTAIRAILGQIKLNDGHLSVFGQNPWTDVVPIHERLAYVPGDVVLWPSLSGGECLDMLAGFHGRENRARRDRLIEAFDLDVAKKSRTYSKGNRQKVALISALSMDVDLLIFDEPTAGLDPIMEVTFQRAVRERVAAGSTVLLSSHILDEVEALCSHVTILRHGATVSSGSLEDLRQSTVTTIHATFDERVVADEIVSRFAAGAGAAGAGAAGTGTAGTDTAGTDAPITSEIIVDETGAHLTMRVGRSQLSDVVAHVASRRPTSLVVRPPSLDELFLEHYKVN